MNKKDAIEVGSRILSIYAFIAAIASLQLPISLWQSAVNLRLDITLSVAVFVPGAILFVFAIALWLSANRIKARSFEEPSSESGTGVKPQLIQSIVLSALAIFLIADSVAPLANSAVLFSSRGFNPNWSASISLNAIPGLLKLALGLWLLVGSKSSQKFRSWLLKVEQKDW